MENREEKKYKVLFVCLGNICRSPSAHGIMEHIVVENGYQSIIEIDSAGTYAGHAGELPDPRMRSHAKRRGYDLTHRSRKVKVVDFEYFDIIIAMDDSNFQNLKDIAPDLESEAKIHRMTEFCTTPLFDHVPDPYYSGAEGFELVLDMLEDGCEGLLNRIVSELK